MLPFKGIGEGRADVDDVGKTEGIVNVDDVGKTEGIVDVDGVGKTEGGEEYVSVAVNALTSTQKTFESPSMLENPTMQGPHVFAVELHTALLRLAQFVADEQFTLLR